MCWAKGKQGRWWKAKRWSSGGGERTVRGVPPLVLVAEQLCPAVDKHCSINKACDMIEVTGKHGT